MKNLEIMEICNKKELVLGVFLLFLGFLYYFFFRDTYFTEKALTFSVNENIPSFVHTLSFALISASFCTMDRKSIAILNWVLINVIFEFIQLFSLEHEIGFLGDFVNGSFDILDILASIGGGLCAWLVIRFI